MEKAFHHYLNDLGSLENLVAFEAERPERNAEPDLGTLIDNVFQHIGDIDRLFNHKFSRKLFCIPIEARSIINRAIRGKEVNYRVCRVHRLSLGWNLS